MTAMVELCGFHRVTHRLAQALGGRVSQALAQEVQHPTNPPPKDMDQNPKPLRCSK